MFNIDNTNKITIVRGDTAVITFEIPNYSLTEGDIVTLTVKFNAQSKVILQKRITEFVDGKAIIEFKENDTKLIEAGDYLYEIECRLMNGNIVDTVITATKFTIIADLG